MVPTPLVRPQAQHQQTRANSRVTATIHRNRSYLVKNPQQMPIRLYSHHFVGVGQAVET